MKLPKQKCQVRVFGQWIEVETTTLSATDLLKEVARKMKAGKVTMCKTPKDLKRRTDGNNILISLAMPEIVESHICSL